MDKENEKGERRNQFLWNPNSNYFYYSEDDEVDETEMRRSMDFDKVKILLHYVSM